MSRRGVRRAGVLAVWVAGILFPAAWLGRYSESYQRYFGVIFEAEWVHIVMHCMIYAVLAGLLVVTLKLPITRGVVLWLGAAILAIGIAQESLQWFSQVGQWPDSEAVSRAVFDLGVDLMGGLVGVGAVRMVGGRGKDKTGQGQAGQGQALPLQ